MFNKLSFEELAEIYGSLATLEKHYGKEVVRDAIKEMADRLDQQLNQPRIQYQVDLNALSAVDQPELKDGDKVTVIDEEAGINVECEYKDGQLALFDEDPEEGSKRQYFGRKQNGYNKMMIHEHFAHENNPEWGTPEEMIIRLYYKDGKTQSEIGKMIGVNQRAISQYLNGIPEKTKRKIMAGWSNE